MRLSRRPAAAVPIDAAQFAAAMARLAPFEPRPRIAVAVSGGPDSMALALLADDWVRARGGELLALTVDHRLRPDSAAEARTVGDWLGALGIAHGVLVWEGEKPASGVQAAARAARYALLADACAGAGILHLAVAHHADDQAETVLFRIGRRTGADGLAGMSLSRSLGPVRLIRPLLAWPKAALAATCAARGQPFLSDPSNRSPRFARTGLRATLGADPERRDALLARAGQAGAARAERERRLAAFLARAAEARPDGAIVLDSGLLRAAGAEARRSALAAALRTAGGGAHPPARRAVAELDRRLASPGFRGASLAGSLVLPWRGRLLIAREPGRVAGPAPLAIGQWIHWDGRFLLRIVGGAAEAYRVGALGRTGYAALRRRIGSGPPAIVGATLPAISAAGRTVAVPALRWAEPGAPEVAQGLAPLWPLAPETFTVVYAEARIICDDVGARPPADGPIRSR